MTNSKQNKTQATEYHFAVQADCANLKDGDKVTFATSETLASNRKPVTRTVHGCKDIGGVPWVKFDNQTVSLDNEFFASFIVVAVNDIDPYEWRKQFITEPEPEPEPEPIAELVAQYLEANEPLPAIANAKPEPEPEPEPEPIAPELLAQIAANAANAVLKNRGSIEAASAVASAILAPLAQTAKAPEPEPEPEQVPAKPEPVDSGKWCTFVDDSSACVMRKLYRLGQAYFVKNGGEFAELDHVSSVYKIHATQGKALAAINEHKRRAKAQAAAQAAKPSKPAKASAKPSKAAKASAQPVKAVKPSKPAKPETFTTEQVQAAVNDAIAATLARLGISPDSVKPERITPETVSAVPAQRIAFIEQARKDYEQLSGKDKGKVDGVIRRAKRLYGIDLRFYRDKAWAWFENAGASIEALHRNGSIVDKSLVMATCGQDAEMSTVNKSGEFVTHVEYSKARGQIVVKDLFA